MSVGMVGFVTDVVVVVVVVVGGGGVAIFGVGSVATWVKGRRRERFES